MKAFTDIEQSNSLAGILPIESADAFYCNDGHIKMMWEHLKDVDITTPCWSLAALLEVLPEHVIMPYYAPYLQKEDGKYHTAYGNDELLCEADNPIDAAVEMILKLKEKDLL